MRSTHVSFSETSSPALSSSSSSSSSSSESGTHSPTLSSSSGPDTSARMADIFARMEQVDDKPQHECGVFGIFGHPELNAAHLTFFALYALQHRGQESCGIATCDGKQIRVHKGMGLVSQVFDEDVTRPLTGRAGIGHVRYSTAGGSRLTNAQPFVLETDLGALAMAHNGQLTRQKDLRKRVLARGTGLFTNSDSEMIAQMLAMPRNISQAEVPFSPAKRKPSISSSSSSDNLKQQQQQQQQQQHSGTNGVTSSVANLTINLPPVTESGKTTNLPLTPNSLAVSNAAAHATSEGTGAALINQAVDGSVVDHRRTATAVPARTTGRISPPRHNSEVDDPYLYQRFDDDPPAGKNMTEWDLRIAEFMRQSEGAYALAFLTPNAIYGCRDRLGLRPLCLGWQKHKDGTFSHAIASESCAFGPIGFTYSREVLPGEIVRLDADGVHSTMALPKLQPTIKPSLCVFEYVYFARPDSLLEDQLVHSVRQKLGSQLAVECATQADIVAGVPDSSIAAAIGYSLVSGLPFMEVLCKNRYIGRTFIQPDQTMRQNSIKLKYNPLSQNLRGKRIVLVDDSLVRGNTLKELIPLLKNAGALEVHVRISSPILRHPCYMGVDIGTYDEILATHLKTIEELNAFIGADSLAYLSHDGMMKAVLDGVSFHKKQTGQVGHCSACFTGEYPLSHDADW